MNDDTTADEVLDDVLREYVHASCNGFAFNYADDHENVVVRVCEVEGGGEHCYVYDVERDLIVDPTLGQFDGLESGVWEGDEHPHELRRWSEHTDHDPFAAEYDAPMSPFVVSGDR